MRRKQDKGGLVVPDEKLKAGFFLKILGWISPRIAKLINQLNRLSETELELKKEEIERKRIENADRRIDVEDKRLDFLAKHFPDYYRSLQYERDVTRFLEGPPDDEDEDS